MAKRRQTGWVACKAEMKGWPPAKFLALLRELHDLSDENRQFLGGRLLSAPTARTRTLEEVKRKLKGMLSPAAVFNDHFRHGEVKRLVEQYAKAVADPALLADLLLTDLETGFATFDKVGDFEPMVDHLYSMMARLEKVLATLPLAAVAPAVERLSELASRWGMAFGYGISDELAGFAEEWKVRMERARFEPPKSA
jgi:hypothetical protein